MKLRAKSVWLNKTGVHYVSMRASQSVGLHVKKVMGSLISRGRGSGMDPPSVFSLDYEGSSVEA